VPTVFVDDPADPRLADFRNLADGDALGRRGLFIVEGRLVVERLLRESPLEPSAVLATEAAAGALGPALAQRPDLDVYVWSRSPASTSIVDAWRLLGGLRRVRLTMSWRRVRGDSWCSRG
jgi:hypothetical protein